MNECKISFVEVCIKNLNFPIKIGSKNKLDGVDTLANITIKAKIDVKKENEFKTQIPAIINNRCNYTGPRELSIKLISFIDSLNAKDIAVNFKFPFFYERASEGLNEKFLIKYPCSYSFKKTSLINFKQKYKVEVPIIAEQYRTIGIPNEFIELPAKIVVSIDSFEAIFFEDLIETVEDNIKNAGKYNLKTTIKDLLSFDNQNKRDLYIIENIKNDFYKKNYIKNCSVEFINRKISFTYSIKVSAEEKLAEKELENADVPLFV